MAGLAYTVLAGPRTAALRDHCAGVQAPKGRGWEIMREQWSAHMANKDTLPGRVQSALSTQKERGTRVFQYTTAGDHAGRVLDTCIADKSNDEQRSLDTLELWKRALNSSSEMRKAVDHAMGTRENQILPASSHPAEALFPADWWDGVSEETVCELIVDAFTGSFVDAFVDGAVEVVDATTRWPPERAGLHQSTSEPALSSLRKPRATRQLRGSERFVTGASASSRLDDARAGEGPAGGFTMAGLSRDPWEAWNARRCHLSKPLDSFKTRIHNATETQRPRRRVSYPTNDQEDQRKYVWPMSATNFPEKWAAATSRPRDKRDKGDKMSASKHGKAQRAEAEGQGGKPLMSIGSDGKTVFPYTLVSHKAFLESLTDPALKETMCKIAPLPTSETW